MHIRFAKASLWGFWAANIAIIISFWALHSGAQWLNGSLSPLIAVGRLAGLLATFCVLTQVVLMGRQGWLEPYFGLDRIARFHRLNGYVALSLLLLHPLLLFVGYSLLAGQPVLLGLYPYVPLAVVALLLFLTTVGTTIYTVRKNLRFETWYYIHIFNYMAIALLPLHQLTNGGDLLSDRLFAAYWIGIYIFAAANVVIWRFSRPLLRFIRFQFNVEQVVSEAPRATSVYITGHEMQRFHAQGGQFVLVRFLTKGLWWQEHPFSLSRLPNKQGIRLTIRQLGDFTNKIPDLKLGTKVIISGPHGAFTAEKSVRDKALYIAGGIGITPIRSILEEHAIKGQHDAIMLYGNRTLQEIVFKDEIDRLGATLSMPIYHVLSDEPNYPEKGFIDREKIARLVPDVAQRDIFLCGPPPMMKGVLMALDQLGVPAKQVHYERFSLH